MSGAPTRPGGGGARGGDDTGALPVLFPSSPWLAIFAIFIGVDLVFKGLVWIAYQGVVAPLSWSAGAVIVVVFSIWLASFVAMTRPFLRWQRERRLHGALDEARTRALARRIHALPRSLALALSLQWTAACVAVSALTGAWHDNAVAAACFCAALAIGPLSLTAALAVVVFAPLTERLSRAAREGPRRPTAITSLRGVTTVFALGVGVAPAFYMASLAFTAQHRAMSHEELLLRVGVLLGGVGFFALLSATFFARGVAHPARMMIDVVERVAQAGGAASAGLERLPVLRYDELGLLAARTNLMIDKLEAAEAQRADAARSLEALNRTLEERVRQGAAALVRAELELREAQRLETLGRLAAGLAHEINTPVQFVNDSVTYVERVWSKLSPLLTSTAPPQPPSPKMALLSARAAEQVPSALGAAREGLDRIAAIVRSMKELAHPGHGEVALVDVNHLIQAALAVGHEACRGVASIELDLAGDLPLVACRANDVSQALLHLIVNAAHAIAEAHAQTVASPDDDTDDIDTASVGAGRIVVTSRRSSAGGDVVVSIADNGTGIRAEIRERVFDPFFTTKEIGRGTGQGLAIARAVIRDRHAGALHFETEVGKGTTFYVRLPAGGSAAAAA